MDYILTPKGEKYVLRIYNNGLNSKRVLFEHVILDQLMLNNKFSFQLPTAIKSIKGKSSGTGDAGNEGVLNSGGLTHVVLSNGAEASLFKFIPGMCILEVLVLMLTTPVCIHSHYKLSYIYYSSY